MGRTADSDLRTMIQRSQCPQLEPIPRLQDVAAAGADVVADTEGRSTSGNH